MEKEVVVY